MKTQLPLLKRHLRSRALTCLLLLMPAAVSLAEGFKAPTTTEFLTQVETLREEHRIPGLSLAVVKDQSLLLAAGLGWADFKNRVAATASTPYNIASVTKPISGVAVMKLVEDGVVELDRPIGEYSRWSEFCESFSQQPSVFARDLQCDPASHTLRHLLSHTAAGVPGSAFSYNPVVFSWASRPVMAAAGKPFSTLVTELVLRPAAMLDSARQHRALLLPEHLAQRLAPPHRIDETGQIIPADPPPPQGDGAAGGIIATVLDLARFDMALDRGELISDRSRAAMLQPTPLTGGGTAPYGIGWYVQDYEGLQLIWHAGWWDQAYSALYLKIPSMGLTIIALANSEGLY
ncbi:MAG: serine hydrolase domain-containing protein, partial [Pseudomonadota bacterium]